VIEPGLIRTSFSDVAVSSIREATNGGPYAGFNAAVAKITKETYERGLLSRLGGGPEAVARTIGRAISSPHPRPRYTVTLSAGLLLWTRKLLPDAAWDMLLRSRYPQPGR
jgi:hypothetical protein